MPSPRPFPSARAVIFDYRNTLIEFGPAQMNAQFTELHNTLERVAGPCDARHLRRVRDRQVVAPYHRDFRENDFREVAIELIRELYLREPSGEEIREVMDARYRSFLGSITRPEGVADLLRELRQTYRLALLSNYPCGDSIRESLRNTGLAEHLEVVVVSGDIGWVKPHPEPFRVVREQLGVPAEDCVFVGDNWLADVQGAKRAGMKSVYITQHESYERFEPAPGDHQPDARIEHLMELRTLLG
ncbi:MAG: HAD family hydrolase [Kiritimatiellia bacterium]